MLRTAFILVAYAIPVYFLIQAVTFILALAQHAI